MAIDDTFPRSNLPDLAVEWGRTVQDEIRSTQKSVNTLSQFTAGQNRTFASSLEQIARQLADIRQTQSFLERQTSYAANDTFFSAANPVGNGFYPFDPEYDLELDITSSNSGGMMITVGANLSVQWTDTTGSGGPVIGVDISWSSGSIPPDVVNAAWVSSSMDYFSGGMSASRASRFDVPGNTPITVKTRRGYNTGTPTNNGTIAIEYPFISVALLR